MRCVSESDRLGKICPCRWLLNTATSLILYLHDELTVYSFGSV